MTPGTLLRERWPRLAAELVAALREEGEHRLADGVEALPVFEECGCADDFCRRYLLAFTRAMLKTCGSARWGVFSRVIDSKVTE